jgi:flagellum-specific peptidoglycan hydrolase FlgJ
MTPSDFIAALLPAAQQSQHTTKVPASFVIADAALESGWGASSLTVLAMNLFGVKADSSWHGDTLTMNTREYVDGAWVVVPAKWRKYSTWLDSLNDHAQFLLTNPRYAGCFDFTDGVGFAEAVAEAGYATDPGYAKKITAIIRGNNLLGFDVSAVAAASVPAPTGPAVAKFAAPPPGSIVLSDAVELPFPDPGQPAMNAEQAADYAVIQGKHA